MARTWALAGVWLAGCTYLNEQDLEARLDLDEDNVPATEDCDPDDPDRAVEADYFADDDGDGAGDPLTTQTFCGPPPEGWVANALDQCPDNAELTSPALWWEDLDGDGFGNADQPYSDCESEPAEERAFPGIPDCDDGDPDATTLVTWYVDGDGDGVGALNVDGVQRCGQPDDEHALQTGDECDDEPGLTRRLRYFVDFDLDGVGGLVEEDLCEVTAPAGHSVLDSDCNDYESLITDEIFYYLDDDDDGYGGIPSVSRCLLAPPKGYSPSSDDCNDGDPSIHPDQLELCDGVDQDCDGLYDEDLVDQLYFHDDDDDGYPGELTESLCAPAPMRILVDTNTQPLDCNDDRADINPGADEVYGAVDDETDHDCNPLNDTDADLDGADRYGEDCNDDNDRMSPFQSEIIGDGLDNDCDPTTLDGDADGDGVEAIVYGGTDCDDNDGSVFPGADERVELAGEEVDDNCVGGHGAYCGLDLDGDDYGDANQPRVVDIDKSASCFRELSFGGGEPVGLPGDCDDGNAATYPTAVELCDGVDSNCDGDRDLRLVTANADGVSVSLPEGTSIVVPPASQSLRIDVCSGTEDPVAISLDFTSVPVGAVLRGVWTGDDVQPNGDGTTTPLLPIVAPIASGDFIVRQGGGGSLRVEGLELLGDGLDDVVLETGELVFSDTVWTGVHARTTELGDAELAVESTTQLDSRSSFDLAGGRLQVEGGVLADQTSPFITADAAVVLLDGVQVIDAAAPLVTATGGTSVTVLELDSTGALAPLYDLELSQLTDVGSTYQFHRDVVFVTDQSTLIALDTKIDDGAGVLSGSSGSFLMVGGRIAGHAGHRLFDGTDHDVSLLDEVVLAGNDAAGVIPFHLDGGDLSLSGVSLDACPADGLAVLTGGDLEVDAAFWSCEAEGQRSPLFDVVGDVLMQDAVFESTTAVPPAVLVADGGRVDLIGVVVEGRGVVTDGFTPTLPVVELVTADASLDFVTIFSDQCNDLLCTGVTGVLATDTVLRGQGLVTTTGGPGVDLQGTSFFGHGGGNVDVGFACNGSETQTHTGTWGMVVGPNASAIMYGCSPAGARFGNCISNNDIVPVECEAGAACVCLAIFEPPP